VGELGLGGADGAAEPGETRARLPRPPVGTVAEGGRASASGGRQPAAGVSRGRASAGGARQPGVRISRLCGSAGGARQRGKRIANE